jgi:hypothetical protein
MYSAMFLPLIISSFFSLKRNLSLIRGGQIANTHPSTAHRGVLYAEPKGVLVPLLPEIGGKGEAVDAYGLHKRLVSVPYQIDDMVSTFSN